MEKKGTQSRISLHATLAEVEPPRGLYQAVMARIEAARRRTAQWHAGFFALLALASGAAMVPVVQYTAEQFYASGFYDYFSLIFSDNSLVLTYWREFGLSLVESLPSLALLLLLPVAAALLWSVSHLIKNARTGFLKYA